MGKLLKEQDMIRCEDGGKVYLIPREIFTRVVMETKCPERKFVRYKTGAEMYDMGERKFMTLAKDAKAIYKLDRLVLVRLDKFDKYLESFLLD